MLPGATARTRVARAVVSAAKASPVNATSVSATAGLSAKTRSPSKATAWTPTGRATARFGGGRRGAAHDDTDKSRKTTSSSAALTIAGDSRTTSVRYGETYVKKVNAPVTTRLMTKMSKT
jgi:hypothetical protein